MKKYFLVLMFVAICSIALGADTEVQDLDAIVSPAGTDVIYIVDDPGGSPASKKISLADLLAEVNWDAIPWETPSEVDLTGVNWDDYANLADITDVNWDEIPLIESAGINWLDVEALQSLSEEMIGDLGSYLTAESDPKVGTLTNLKWCVSDGSQVICDTDAPVTTETDPVFGAWDGATGVNWDAFPNAQGYLDSVNWDEMPLIMTSGVNWLDIEAMAPINDDAVNWASMTDLATGGAVVWANLAEGELPDSSVVKADINWLSIDNIEDEHVNWLAFPTYTDDYYLRATGTGVAFEIVGGRKCFSWFDPVEADSPTFHPFDKAVTVTDVLCFVVGGTSAVATAGDGTNSFEAITCDAGGEADDGSITNATFTADEGFNITLGTVTGEVTQFEYCIDFN